MKMRVCVRQAAALMLAAALFAVSACGGQNASGGSRDEGTSAYAEALDVLEAVLDAYGEDELFAIAGGDQENMVMDAPGRFDVSRTEEMDLFLGLPESQASAVDDAASMVHMMNGNTFTGAAYHLKDGTDAEAFAGEIESNLAGRQWMCGQPDTLLIIDVDGAYVVTAYGEAEIMEIFKNHALDALDGSAVLVEASLF